MRLAVPWLSLLAACGPVMLGEELASAPSAGAGGLVGGQGGANAGAASIEDPSTPDASFPLPSVVIRLQAEECGACFELFAQGLGGLPPYTFEWADGSVDALRSVCVAQAGTILSVVAIDAAGARSEAQVIHLEHTADAGCPEADAQADASAPAELLCLDNTSLEGTPAISYGDPAIFDADPWSLCSNTTDPPNAPDIGNPTISPTQAPMPTDGVTYLALGEGEQVSQELCGPVTGDVPLHLELDVASIAIGELVPNAEQIFLEIWGGLSVDCSQRELLWASRALTTEWQRVCVTLRPRSYMTQLTLRGASDMASGSLGHVLVDNLQPVASCP